MRNLIFASVILLPGCFSGTTGETTVGKPPLSNVPVPSVLDEPVVPVPSVSDEPVVPVPVVSTEPKTVGPISIAQGSDDGYSWGFNGTGWVNNALDFENLRFGGAGDINREYIVSFMFRGIDVPAGAKILSAKLIFTEQVYQNESGIINLNIRALDPVSSLTFSPGNMAQDRVALSASVNWDKSSNAIESPDISMLVQSIVDDSDWQRDSAMSFKISNSPGAIGGLRHNLYAYDAGVSDGVPQLLITYSDGVVEPVPVDPIPVDPIPVVPTPVEPISGITSRSTVMPQISSVPDQFVTHKTGEDLSFAISISNQSSLDGIIHWTKDYGPDGVVVHPETGRVTWDIDDSMPSESFHIGLKASSQSDSVNLSFIVHAGVEEVISVGEGGDYPNIKAGLKVLGAGGTMVVLDGLFNGEDNYIGMSGGSTQHPASGNAAAYTTIMAQHPGMSTLDGGASISLDFNNPVSYVAFKGFYVINGQVGASGQGEAGESGSQRHHHLKFIRNGVQGGDVYEQPFSASRVDNVLFENNYVFGAGRYKFASYHAENIVWRRNVARFDRGLERDSATFNKPFGTYSVYSSKHTFLGNNLAIDSDNPDFVNKGELAGEFATPTTSGDSSGRFHRNIQLNSAFLFANIDDQSGGEADVEFRDVVSWDVRPASRYVMTWGSGWFDHMTMGNITPREHADQFFNGYHNKTRGITNSVLHNFQNGDMFYSLRQDASHVTVDDRAAPRYGVDTVNISDFSGSLVVNNSDIQNTTDLNPVQSSDNLEGGLRYLTRVEQGTNLKELAKDGEGLGATVMTFVGKSGTLFGETGYDVETNIPMWPFPMEDLIKEKFAQYTYTGMRYTGHYASRTETTIGSIKGARGFAVTGQSLTNYVWGYLGNVVPPFNVTATAGQASVLLQWSASPTVSQDLVVSYEVYQYYPATKTKEWVATVTSDNLSYKAENLDAGVEYHFILTAQTSESESGFSYVVTATVH